jgi:hypothetical protein
MSPYSWGYNNVRIHEGDEWKAAFCTNRGLFEPLVMYFGLTNSPATFQMMMNEIFQDLITKGIISIHLDDILIFTNSLEEHRQITCLVLDRMREHKLYLQPEKCEFKKTRIEYLGVIISHNKVEMDPVKIAGVETKRRYNHSSASSISTDASSLGSPIMRAHSLT